MKLKMTRATMLISNEVILRVYFVKRAGKVKFYCLHKKELCKEQNSEGAGGHVILPTAQQIV